MATTLDQDIKEVLSDSRDDINSGILKDTLVHSIHSKVSQSNISMEERDNHPFMKRLYEAQDGMVFHSYHDIYAFSHDLVSGLPTPGSDLLVSSSETEEILIKLEDESLSQADQDKLEDQYHHLCKELNDLVMKDKMRGFFHEPKSGVIHISDEKISKYREMENAPPSSGIEKNPTNDSSFKAPMPGESGEASEAGAKPRKDPGQSIQFSKSSQVPQQSSQQRSYQAPSQNPVGYAGAALGGIVMNSLSAMGSGMGSLLETAFSKAPSGKHSFLMGLSQKNHALVSDNIRDNSIAMEELTSLAGKKDLKSDDILAARDLMYHVKNNLTELRDKKKRGVLSNEDRQAIYRHTENMEKGILGIENSPLKNALNDIGFDLDEIVKSLKRIMMSIMGKKEPVNEPESPAI